MKNKFARFFLMFAIACTAQEKVNVMPAFTGLQGFDKVRDFTMDKKGTEAYLTVQSPTEEVSVIVRMEKANEEWKPPKIASFSGKFKDLEPFLAPDGLRLYFVSNRPLHDSITQPKDFDIWYVERAGVKHDWSNPINLGAPVNSDSNEFYPAVATNGNMYFTCDCDGAMGRDDIFFTAFKEGSYTAPIALDSNVNSEGFEYNSYISRDDSYLIFGGYNRPDGLGSGDLYISFKDAQGSWSKAKPLPASINSPYMDYCPYMDELNNVIYFTSRRATKPENRFTTLADLQSFLDGYQNGSSRLYKAKFDIHTMDE